MNEIDEEVAKLRAERDRLKERLAAIEADYRKGLDPDSEERAIQLENAEVLAGIAKAISEELVQVEEKLADLG
ncbi:hypothetical protein BOW53_07675 [Solemya pervernicosa gill symbiont]|uniref:DnaK suppressor protein-like N-terminal domain-containing protein n=2 Tax=Gammaproteobacteria incertae sedis TaxID=118884 RepID=A0A1T2L5Q3_9GAMM|nr:hypothetical protein [Candidatus Reidiella endopervernicosa]OOZ40445.1 hypothetical protein BOW53_07675 [Solemya pervernicosa gill symbiont]QKQ25359.1 hypothetical protein HUE57_02935 [Candidatus Reidiella endopervernicosa]